MLSACDWLSHFVPWKRPWPLCCDTLLHGSQMCSWWVIAQSCNESGCVTIGKALFSHSISTWVVLGCRIWGPTMPGSESGWVCHPFCLHGPCPTAGLLHPLVSTVSPTAWVQWFPEFHCWCCWGRLLPSHFCVGVCVGGLSGGGLASLVSAGALLGAESPTRSPGWWGAY